MTKIAVVVGGTSGIGLATAHALLEGGARVAVIGRDAERGERAACELGEAAQFVRADIAEPAQVDAAIAAVVARWGRLDWAVNAAALADHLELVPTAEIREDDWARTIAVDLTGVWACMRAELRALLAAGGGAIVNVSSVNGLSGTPLAAAYCAAKHGVHGLSQTAAVEYAPHGIRVNVVCPGAHRTPMLEAVFARIAPGDLARAEAMYAARIPAGRIGDPRECGRVIAWLLSDAASYVSGAIVTVDGALSAA
jgi:NAD(P)-dependent dehydrogenase (short-subunit alcohol dehydrogenase family)